jgi:hypothetical protein
MTESHASPTEPGEVAAGYADARFDAERDRPPRPVADRSPAYQRGYALGYHQLRIVDRLRRLEDTPAEEYYVDLGPVRRLLEFSAALAELLDGFDLAPTLGGVDARRRSPEKAAVSQTLQYLERLLVQAQALVGVEYHRLRNMPDVVGMDDADRDRLLSDLQDLRHAGPAVPAPERPADA